MYICMHFTYACVNRLFHRLIYRKLSSQIFKMQDNKYKKVTCLLVVSLFLPLRGHRQPVSCISPKDGIPNSRHSHAAGLSVASASILERGHPVLGICASATPQGTRHTATAFILQTSNIYNFFSFLFGNLRLGCLLAVDAVFLLLSPAWFSQDNHFPLSNRSPSRTHGETMTSITVHKHS